MARHDRSFDASLSCHVHRDVGADGLRIELVGELDLATVGAARDAIHDAEAQDLVRIVLDLRGLTFMDSTGLHMLLQAHRRMAETGLRLAIVQGNAAIRRLFELTGTDRHLPIVGSVSQETGAPEALRADQVA